MNVGGTGKLVMSDLRAICDAAGFTRVETHIASGNVVFCADMDEADVQRDLAARLASHAGRPLGVLLRSGAAMGAIQNRNPFPDTPGNRLVVLFLDSPATPELLDTVSGKAADEEIALGDRELYVRYGADMGRSKLRVTGAMSATGRNMNTVRRLAAMAAERDRA